MHSIIQERWVAGTTHAVKTQVNPTEFERLCFDLSLDPENIEALAVSPEIKNFCEQNKNTHYIPEALLRRLTFRLQGEEWTDAPPPVLQVEEAQESVA